MAKGPGVVDAHHLARCDLEQPALELAIGEAIGSTQLGDRHARDAVDVQGCGNDRTEPHRLARLHAVRVEVGGRSVGETPGAEQGRERDEDLARQRVVRDARP